MPVVNPGIRRQVAGAITRLFNSAAFALPLTHTAVPTRAASGTTATFTRATTSTWPNNDGYMVTGVAGEIGFVGARRIYNYIGTTTEDFSNAAWSKGAGVTLSKTETNPLNGAATATLVTCVGATDGTSRVVSVPIGTSQLSWYLKKSGSTRYPCCYIQSAGSASADYITVDMTLGTVVSQHTGSGAQAVSDLVLSDEGDGWYRITGKVVASAVINIVGSCIMPSQAAIAFTAGAYIQYAPQIISVTGRTDQTTPSEYVSVGVESAPYYHGAGVDGVKCFPTDISGNPIPSTTLLGYQAEGARTNLCLQSNALTTTPWATSGTPTPTQNVIGPDGAVSAWTLTDDDSGATELSADPFTPTAATHTASVFVKKTSGAQSSYPLLMVDKNPEAAMCTIDTSNGVATLWPAYTGRTIQPSSVVCRSFNDDYWRVELTFLGVAGSWNLYLIPAGALTPTYAGPAFEASAAGSAVFYGAQVELGSFASSYIATTTVAVTRNADVLTYSSAGNIDGTKGWAYAEAGNTLNTAGLRQQIVATYPSGNGLILDVYTTASPATIEFYDGAAFRSGQTYTQSLTPQKFSASWGTGCRTAVGGSVTASLTFDGDAAAGTAIAIGNYTDGSGTGWFGTIRNVRIGQRQLSASELGAITS